MPSSSSLIRFSDRKSEQSLVKNRNPNALEIHACKCRNLFFKASIQFLFSISKNCPMMNFTCCFKNSEFCYVLISQNLLSKQYLPHLPHLKVTKQTYKTYVKLKQIEVSL